MTCSSFTDLLFVNSLKTTRPSYFRVVQVTVTDKVQQRHPAAAQCVLSSDWSKAITGNTQKPSTPSLVKTYADFFRSVQIFLKEQV